MAGNISEESEWPPITEEERTRYDSMFYCQDPLEGLLPGENARELFLKSGLPLPVLSQIWNLADVSHDNLLEVHEFAVAMHLVQGKLKGRRLPMTLPDHLFPSAQHRHSTDNIPLINETEIAAYRKAFQIQKKDDTECLDAKTSKEILHSSKLPSAQLATIWNLADVDRDGKLNQDEFAIACHLVRHFKKGAEISGSFNVLALLPHRTPPSSLERKRQQMAGVEARKQKLMNLKERRKNESLREKRRLQLEKDKLKIMQEQHKTLQENGIRPMKDVELQEKITDKTDNIKKIEKVTRSIDGDSDRLDREHQKVRQETAKLIMEESKLYEGIRSIEIEAEELKKQHAKASSKATKDEDPFHKLHEERKEERMKGKISPMKEYEVCIPQKADPFSPLATPTSGQELFNDFDSDQHATSDAWSTSNGHSQSNGGTGDFAAFEDNFIEVWGQNRSPEKTSESGGSDFLFDDDDPIFKTIPVTAEEDDLWCTIIESAPHSPAANDNEQIALLQSKLAEVRSQMEELGKEGGQLVFRDPEDYTRPDKEEPVATKIDFDLPVRRRPRNTAPQPVPEDTGVVVVRRRKRTEDVTKRYSADFTGRTNFDVNTDDIKERHKRRSLLLSKELESTTSELSILKEKIKRDREILAKARAAKAQAALQENSTLDRFAVKEKEVSPSVIEKEESAPVLCSVPRESQSAVSVDQKPSSEISGVKPGPSERDLAWIRTARKDQSSDPALGSSVAERNKHDCLTKDKDLTRSTDQISSPGSKRVKAETGGLTNGSSLRVEKERPKSELCVAIEEPYPTPPARRASKKRGSLGAGSPRLSGHSPVSSASSSESSSDTLTLTQQPAYKPRDSVTSQVPPLNVIGVRTLSPIIPNRYTPSASSRESTPPPLPHSPPPQLPNSPPPYFSDSSTTSPRLSPSISAASTPPITPPPRTRSPSKKKKSAALPSRSSPSQTPDRSNRLSLISISSSDSLDGPPRPDRLARSSSVSISSTDSFGSLERPVPPPRLKKKKRESLKKKALEKPSHSYTESPLANRGDGPKVIPPETKRIAPSLPDTSVLSTESSIGGFDLSQRNQALELTSQTLEPHCQVIKEQKEVPSLSHPQRQLTEQESKFSRSQEISKDLSKSNSIIGAAELNSETGVKTFSGVPAPPSSPLHRTIIDTSVACTSPPPVLGGDSLPLSPPPVINTDSYSPPPSSPPPLAVINNSNNITSPLLSPPLSPPPLPSQPVITTDTFASLPVEETVHSIDVKLDHSSYKEDLDLKLKKLEETEKVEGVYKTIVSVNEDPVEVEVRGKTVEVGKSVSIEPHKQQRDADMDVVSSRKRGNEKMRAQFFGYEERGVERTVNPSSQTLVLNLDNSPPSFNGNITSPTCSSDEGVFISPRKELSIANNNIAILKEPTQHSGAESVVLLKHSKSDDSGVLESFLHHEGSSFKSHSHSHTYSTDSAYVTEPSGDTDGDSDLSDTEGSFAATFTPKEKIDTPPKPNIEEGELGGITLISYNKSSTDHPVMSTPKRYPAPPPPVAMPGSTPARTQISQASMTLKPTSPEPEMEAVVEEPLFAAPIKRDEMEVRFHTSPGERSPRSVSPRPVTNTHDKSKVEPLKFALLPIDGLKETNIDESDEDDSDDAPPLPPSAPPPLPSSEPPDLVSATSSIDELPAVRVPPSGEPVLLTLKMAESHGQPGPPPVASGPALVSTRTTESKAQQPAVPPEPVHLGSMKTVETPSLYRETKPQQNTVEDAKKYNRPDIIPYRPQNIDIGPVDDSSISNQEAIKQHWEERFSSLDKDELFPKANIHTRNRFLQQQDNQQEKGEPLEPGEVIAESIGDLSQTKKIWEQSIKETKELKQKEFKREKPLRQWSTSAPTTPTGNQGPPEMVLKPSVEPLYEESAIEKEIRLTLEREAMLQQEQQEYKRSMESSTPEPLLDDRGYGSATYTSSQSDISSSRPESVIEREIREQFEREESLKREGQLRQAQINKEDVQSEYERQEKEQERIDAHESIIERDIRLQRERENEIAKERSVLAGISRSVSAPVSLNTAPERQVLTQPPPPSVPSTPTAQPVQPTRPVIQQQVAPPVHRSRPPAQPARHSRTVESSSPSNMALGKDDKEILSYEAAIANTSHPGESKIAQELREARDREEELRRSWHDRGMQVDAVQQTSLYSEEVLPQANNNHNVEKARRASVDSESSSRSSSSIQSPPPVKEQRVVKVQPYMGDAAEEDERAYKYRPQSETPIEKEIRLFKEREEALRREKGLLATAPKQQQKDTAAAAHDERPQKAAGPVFTPGDLPDGRLTMKRLATSRLQQEIQLEKQRELALRKEGIIHTTSEERIGEPMKYVEVKPVDTVDSPTKTTPKKNTYHANRFSATKEQFNKPQGDINVQIIEQKTLSSKAEPVASQTIAPAEKTPVPRQSSPVPKPVTIVSPPAPVPQVVAPSVPNGAHQEVVMRRHGSSSSSSSVGQLPLANGEKFVIRRSINAAETKIEQELREMREREEELKRLRNISRGGSQALPSRAPGQAESAAAAPAPAAPTTQHAEDIKKKRRSLLAEQWEQKFQ